MADADVDWICESCGAELPVFRAIGARWVDQPCPDCGKTPRDAHERVLTANDVLDAFRKN